MESLSYNHEGGKTSNVMVSTAKESSRLMIWKQNDSIAKRNSEFQAVKDAREQSINEKIAEATDTMNQPDKLVGNDDLRSAKETDRNMGLLAVVSGKDNTQAPPTREGNPASAVSDSLELFSFFYKLSLTTQ